MDEDRSIIYARLRKDGEVVLCGAPQARLSDDAPAFSPGCNGVFGTIEWTEAYTYSGEGELPAGVERLPGPRCSLVAERCLVFEDGWLELDGVWRLPDQQQDRLRHAHAGDGRQQARPRETPRPSFNEVMGVVPGRRVRARCPKCHKEQVLDPVRLCYVGHPQVRPRTRVAHADGRVLSGPFHT
jgi:hypothetical protein